MLEATAVIFFVLWVVGLLSSYGGWAIHLLLAGAILTLVLRSYLGSKTRSMGEVSPAGILAIMTRRSREEP